jgi:hypothetical protein
MNYLAHGYRFANEPYFLAGTAAPDWLSVIDRKMRLRSKTAAQFAEHSDPLVAALARGIVQHHADDAWFHQTAAFNELNLSFAVVIRDYLPGDEGFRPSFLGHILVELLLDATLAAEEPGRLDAYYAALAAIDPRAVEAAINQLATRTSDRVSQLVPRFCRERFLYDYLDDQRLFVRLNHVMRRVGLPQLPQSLAGLFPAMRSQVGERRYELLPAQQVAV